MAALSPRQREILEFEERWPMPSDVKDDAILRHLHIRPVRYYQLLNAAMDNPEALVAMPMLVKRLLRARSRKDWYRANRVFR